MYIKEETRTSPAGHPERPHPQKSDSIDLIDVKITVNKLSSVYLASCYV